MGKHIADEPRHEAGDSRVQRYAEIERKGGEEPGRAAKALHRQEKPRDPEEKLKRFTDIERKGE
ncbi:MAG: hypothetical protein MUF63_13705 [Rhodobacteraceae bacterium]|nr:hypothetical protein [Paracoccaceae bacterium]